MDEDRVKGVAKQATGKIWLVVGNTLGDAKLEADGKSDILSGKIQNTVGSLKDALKE